jgi:YjbR protein
MLTADDFRRIALGLKDVLESAHMGHPDFRVNGRIFATIHPDPAYGMVKLTPEQQLDFVRAHPAAFAPENGAWGRAGCTSVRLASVDEDTLGEAMTLARQNVARARAAKTSKPSRTPSRARKPARAEKRRR